MELAGEAFRQVLLPLLMLLLFAAAIALLRTLAAKTEDERLRAFIDELVKAAEQLYGAKTGETKKAWVKEQAMLNGRDAPDPMIEAAVFALNGGCSDDGPSD